MIECNVGGHKYQTAKLLFEDFTNLGAMLEEKVFPFFTCFMACIANDLSDAELLKALYTSCKDVFNREDMKLIKDNPSVHRKLSNMDLSGFNNNYLRLLSLYNKILKQRNS